MVYVLLLFEMLFLLSTACHAEEEKMKKAKGQRYRHRYWHLLTGRVLMPSRM